MNKTDLLQCINILIEHDYIFDKKYTSEDSYDDILSAYNAKIKEIQKQQLREYTENITYILNQTPNMLTKQACLQLINNNEAMNIISKDFDLMNKLLQHSLFNSLT